MNAPIRSMPELIGAIRARKNELDLSDSTVEAISGLPDRYLSKVLADKPIKNIGPLALEGILGALGLVLVMQVDPEVPEQIRKRWTKRKRPDFVDLKRRASIPTNVDKLMELLENLTPKERILMGAKNGGKRRAKVMGKRARQAQAAHAARKRWAKRAQSQ